MHPRKSIFHKSQHFLNFQQPLKFSSSLLKRKIKQMKSTLIIHFIQLNIPKIFLASNQYKNYENLCILFALNIFNSVCILQLYLNSDQSRVRYSIATRGWLVATTSICRVLRCPHGREYCYFVYLFTQCLAYISVSQRREGGRNKNASSLRNEGIVIETGRKSICYIRSLGFKSRL